MLCSPNLAVVQGIVMVFRITVAEPDQGQVNHLLQTRLNCNHIPIAVSYTGKAPLGTEGEWIRVRWTGTCESMRSVTETPDGPVGGRAWLCTADKAEVLR